MKRRNRVIVERTLGKARNRKMSMAFDGWYSVAQDRIRNRYLVNKIIGRLINSQYVKAFTTWQRKFYAAKKLEEQGLEEDPITRQMRRVIVRMSNSFLSAGLSKWYEWLCIC